MVQAERDKDREGELWLCNVITVLFNLSERALISIITIPLPQTLPLVPHNEAKFVWDPAGPPPYALSALSRAVYDSTLSVFSQDQVTTVRSHRTNLALASFCQLSSTRKKREMKNIGIHARI